MHDLFHCVTLVILIRTAAPRQWEHIVMQVAVAQMPKAVDPERTDPCYHPGRIGDEAGQRAERQRDVMRADRAEPPVCRRDRLADMPKGLLLRL